MKYKSDVTHLSRQNRFTLVSSFEIGIMKLSGRYVIFLLDMCIDSIHVRLGLVRSDDLSQDYSQAYNLEA